MTIKADGKAVKGRVLSRDRQNDLALLKADFNPEEMCPISNRNPKLMQEVYGAGYPFGGGSSIKVTKGIVSSLSGLNGNFSNIQIDADTKSLLDQVDDAVREVNASRPYSEEVRKKLSNDFLKTDFIKVGE